ncbi:MAG: tRNA epoxyqueuosine(34) reductase QueG [Pseudomonadota bacterium]
MQLDLKHLKQLIQEQALELGFLEARISRATINKDAQHNFEQWLKQGYAGEMDYLTNNRQLRFAPETLHNNTLSIISVKAPYLTQSVSYHKQRLSELHNGYISSYALGRDYHKVVKQQLNKLAKFINQYLGQFNLEHNFRVFTDSAPIMEVQLAMQAGNGWRGKHTLLINQQHGSMFFLGEIFTNLALEADAHSSSHCGSCHKCLDVCPTQAIIAPYQLDATRCIAYLTIENSGSIPEQFRQAIGNRIYGCDDCQLFCPWNKFSQLSTYADFKPRHQLDQLSLYQLFSWNEAQFIQKMQGSPIYRIGFNAWQRNLAIAIGNAPYDQQLLQLLKQRLATATAMVQEHISWAIEQQLSKLK